jgi:hypothetical protein
VSTVAPHGCGMCDGTLAQTGTDGPVPSYNCADCGAWHTARDCCAGPLAQHMEAMHAPYGDEGRAVSVERYARIVHELDHQENEGIAIPHTHGPAQVPPPPPEPLPTAVLAEGDAPRCPKCNGEIVSVERAEIWLSGECAHTEHGWSVVWDSPNWPDFYTVAYRCEECGTEVDLNAEVVWS